MALYRQLPGMTEEDHDKYPDIRSAVRKEKYGGCQVMSLGHKNDQQ